MEGRNLLFAKERKNHHEKKEENNTHTQARVIVDKPQRSLSMGRIRVIFPEKDEKCLPSSKSLHFPGFDFRAPCLSTDSHKWQKFEYFDSSQLGGGRFKWEGEDEHT